MRLDSPTCRERMQTARVAHLATAGTDLRPHLVPVTFAVINDTIVIGVDQKPKTTTNLRRLRNINENPAAAMLCDHYDEDWTQLWWVRIDGSAQILREGKSWSDAIRELAAKYPQYAADPPRGPVIRIDVTTWSGWAHGS